MRNVLILTALMGFRPGPLPAGEIVSPAAFSFADLKSLAELKAIEPSDFAVTVTIVDGEWRHLADRLPPEFEDDQGGSDAVDPPIVPPPAADVPANDQDAASSVVTPPTVEQSTVDQAVVDPPAVQQPDGSSVVQPPAAAASADMAAKPKRTAKAKVS